MPRAKSHWPWLAWKMRKGPRAKHCGALWKLEKKPPEEPALRHLALAQGDHVGLLPSSLHSSHRIFTTALAISETAFFEHKNLLLDPQRAELTTMALN